MSIRGKDALAIDQIDIPLPQQHLGVARAVKLFRRLGQRLAEHRQLFDEDGHLAGVGQAQRAVDADDVAQVEVLDQLPLLFGNVGLGDHQLNAAGGVLQVIELELSLVVAEHEPPRHADRFAGDARLGRSLRASGRDRNVAVEPMAPRIESERLDRLELFETFLLESIRLVRIVSCRGARWLMRGPADSRSADSERVSARSI